MTNLWQDVRYGFRVLLKSPGFTAVAVLTLALGMGTNSALFSVVNGVLLKPLPFPEADRLYALYSRTSNFETSSISYLNFVDWHEQNRCFAALGMFRADDYNLTGVGEPERLHAHMISADFFPAYGLPMILGRNFLSEEDRAGAEPVALLGDGLWKRKFASSSGVLGQHITLNGKSYTVIGVAPSLITGLSPTDIFVPIGQWTDPTFRDRHISMGGNAIGRLKPGVTFEQAKAEMDAIGANLAATYPEADKGTGITIVPLKTDVVGDVRPILLVLFGAVGFVLLIACANVANLLLARSTARGREFAVRTALGASPGRVVRQLLTESAILGVAGGVFGLLFARWGLAAILAALPQDVLPRAEEISLDVRVVLFTLGLALLTGIVFGLAPALSTLRPDMHETLKEGGRGSSGTRHRTQSVFVAAEIALALVLLIGAGLMIRSLTALWGVDPGFDPRNVLTFNVSLTSKTDASAADLRAGYRTTLHEFESIPGVQAVSPLAGSLPMAGDSELPFWLEGQPKPSNQSDMPFALFYLVTPAYPKVMGIPIERGRFFSDSDDERSPAVAVIDSTFARKYFPKVDPIGKRLNMSLLDIQVEIVGVAGHIEHWGLGSREHQNLQAQIYLPFWQLPDRFWSLTANGSSYVLRTAGPLPGLLGAVRTATAKVDPSSVVYNPHPMEEIVAASISTQRMAMMLLSAFSALALLLAAVGIYGVISYLAGQRTHEIGVRVALGASRQDVLRLVLGQALRITLFGVGAGLLAAVGLTRLIAKLIYGVGTTDPITFGGVALILSCVALLACAIPATRAMRVDPIIALRYE